MSDASGASREVEGGWGAAWERWTGLEVAGVVAAVGLGVAAAQNGHLLNTDGVAYMRIGHYWATGQWGLAVSGYWGPLLSWMMVPFFWLGLEPLTSARVAMAISGWAFWLGVVAVGRAAGLREGWVRLAGWVSIPPVVAWSVENIVPDLLMGAGVAGAVAAQMSPRWVGDRRRQAMAGVVWALAYMAKAIAFPLGMVVTGLLAGCWGIAGRGWGEVGRAWKWTVGVFLVGCIPWMAVLSAKYGRPTFSTSGAIAHAVVGPPDVERGHPYGRTFQRPEAGRITVWEEPSRMDYAYWSPWASWGYFRHQVGLMTGNVRTVVGLVGGLGGWGVAYVGLVGCGWPVRRRREVLGEERWRWGLVVVVALAALYVPVYVKPVDARYFQPAWPLVAVAVCGVGGLAVGWGGLGSAVAGRGTAPVGGGRVAWWWMAMVGLWLVWPYGGEAVRAWEGRLDPASLYAQDLAKRLRGAGVKGPMGGHGLVAGGRVGLLTAFLVGEPWHGERPGAGVEEYVGSGAKVFVVGRRQAAAGVLAADPRFEDLDAGLFGGGEEAADYALKVFRLKDAGVAGEVAR